MVTNFPFPRTGPDAPQREDRILFVDDDPSLLDSFVRCYRKLFAVEVAHTPTEALHMIELNGPYAVIVSDMHMAGMTGVEFFERCSKHHPDSMRIMLTGTADQQTSIDAVNHGHVHYFISKPCAHDDLATIIRSCLETYKASRVERGLMETTVTGCAGVLSEILGMVSPEALSRGQKLRDSIAKFARHLEMKTTWEVELGALLSPIGYASLPPALLRRVLDREKLSPKETEAVKRIPSVGHRLLVDIPRLSNVAAIVLHQNRNFDGSGATDGVSISGAEIPLGSRMIKIFSDRMLLEVDGVVKAGALKQMQAKPGIYDPKLLEASFVCFPEFLASAVSAQAKVLNLNIDQLRIGQIVVADITSEANMTLLSSGTRITGMILDRLKNHLATGDMRDGVLVQNA